MIDRSQQVIVTHARRLLRHLTAALTNALLLAGGALIALTWLAATIKVKLELQQAEQQSIAEARNFALLFEQDVLRTASELDRTIKYLRQSYERTGYSGDWASLVREEHTVNNRTVQIAVIDRSGTMITSTAMPYPKSRVDLSDREHFKVHVDAREDRLFVSKPVLGRASSKWSVQFTRRFSLADRSFGGVIVVSLDPDALVSTYTKLSDFDRGSFILIGTDGIVRAAAGERHGDLGSGYREGTRFEVTTEHADGTGVFREDRAGQRRLVATRRVGELPLEVIVSAPETYKAQLHRDQVHYFLTASLVTMVVVFAVAQAMRRQRNRFTEMTTLAHTDILTGLQNRLSFRAHVSDVFRLPTAERAYALHLIDLDKFKAVNDTYGHQVGDLLLKSVAERLRNGVRAGDVVFRLGGDEFALLQCDCTSYTQAGIVAERLCTLMANPFEIDGNTLQIGASIGVVAGSEDFSASEGVLQAADMALYLAKSEGRGTHRFYNQEMDQSLARRRQLEAELLGASDRGELELHYQPKLTLRSAAPVLVGYEALVRWRHPNHGMMPPMEFIQIAEETGAITAIGEWVLRQACRDALTLPDHVTVAVNCSAAQFARGNVDAIVANILASTELPASRLEIEITETMLMRNDQRTLSQLENMRQLGVRISLDDFGTGFSSLSYLHSYPVDCIKVDRSFVKTIGTDRDAGPIIRAIIAMASELGLTTVAEGVENQEQLRALQGFGCTAAQGYLFSPPKPACDIFHTYATRHLESAA